MLSWSRFQIQGCTARSVCSTYCQNKMLTSFEFLVNYFQIREQELLVPPTTPIILFCFGSASDSNQVQECTCLLRMGVFLQVWKLNQETFFSLAFRLYVLITIKGSLKKPHGYNLCFSLDIFWDSKEAIYCVWIALTASTETVCSSSVYLWY